MSPNDSIDAEFKAPAVREEPQAPIALFSGEAKDVVAQAVKVADALKDVIVQKGLVKKIQGREFVEVAGWQTVATMCGVTAFCEWSRPVENGWEARVTVRRNGFDIGAAEAQCTKSERTWAGRDDYALRSMAQTRATSKALRSVLGFIVVLAGYADTPAEEMPPEGQETPVTARRSAAEVKTDARRGPFMGEPVPPRSDRRPASASQPAVDAPSPAAESGISGASPEDPVKKGQALDALSKLKRDRHVSNHLFQSLLLEMAPQYRSPKNGFVSEGDLTIQELREIWQELNKRTKGPEPAYEKALENELPL